jgi:multidrug efflux system outer membrane protein
VSDYENILLTLTADLAVNYFVLRSLDAEIAALRRTVELRDETVRVLRERFAAGIAPEVELAQAETEAASARVELNDVERQRAETLHALALLCGKPASSFQVGEPSGRVEPVVVPADLPSRLLERRPDIARAERELAARNAEIGVARAAYFPAVRLTGQAGYFSAEAENLFSVDSRVWSIGPAISVPLFNAGRTTAQVKRAEAAYHEALARYRQAVLSAFKEVEDSLSQIVLRRNQAVAQDEAVESARRVVNLTKVRYEAGSGGFLELVDAERTLLQHERQLARLAAQRLTASVRLVKALGGGWDGE